jgi:hypothetical protein
MWKLVLHLICCSRLMFALKLGVWVKGGKTMFAYFKVDFYLFIILFRKHKYRPNLTSHCYPQVKFSARGPTRLSLAIYLWVWTHNLFEVPRSQTTFSLFNFYFIFLEKTCGVFKICNCQKKLIELTVLRMNIKWIHLKMAS